MSCPDDKTLRLFLDARLDEEQNERIDEHLEHCPTCSERVTQLERSRKSPLITGLKGIDLKNFTDDSDDDSDDDFRLPTEPVPESIGNYTILGLLGSGGMGTVYRGVNPHLNRPAAVKVIKASRALRSSSAERFQRELLAIGKLRHPNIVEAFDAGMYENRPYLAMELLEGEDLSHYVKEHGPLPVKEACDIIRQAALGLQHAHEAGLVHRDIKPSNLFRTKEGTIKILDLGLARLLETESDEDNPNEKDTASAPDTTAEGQILGSPDYMSPEQAVNAKSVDVRSDLYSLGCTFFYLLTGTPPFGESTHPELEDKIKAHTDQDLPSLENFRKDVPTVVKNLLNRMVVKRQEDRLQSAKEVANILERYLRPAWKRILLPLFFSIACFAVAFGYVAMQPETLPSIIVTEAKPELIFDWKPIRTIVTEPAPVNSAFFTADGNGIVEGRDDGNVFLWDAATGKQLVAFERGNSPFNSMAVSWDRTLLAAGCQSGFVLIWNMVSGKFVDGFRFSDDPITSVALSMDASRLFMTTRGRARVFRITDGETFKTTGLKSGSNVDLPIFSPDGHDIICCDNRSIGVFDSNNLLERSRTNFKNRVSNLKLSPGLDFLVLAEGSDHIKLIPRLGDTWEYDIRNESTGIKTISSPGCTITCVALSSDTRVLATAETNSSEYFIQLWNRETETIGQTITLETIDAPITSLDFSPDANRLLARSGETLMILEKSKPGSLSWSPARPPEQIALDRRNEPFAPKTHFEKKSQIYDDWKLDQRLSGTPGDPMDAYFVSDGREIVYMQSNGVFHRHSKSGGQSGKVVQSPATAFTLSNDERIFAFAGTKRLNDPITDAEGRIINRYTEITVVYICNTEKKRVIHTITPRSLKKGPITSLAFSLDARRLFIGGLGGEIWTLPESSDMQQGEQKSTKDGNQYDGDSQPIFVLNIKAVDETVSSSIFSPDGGEIVYGTDQGNLYHHSTLKNEGPKLLQSFPGFIRCMKYGNDFGKLYVADGTNKITVFSWTRQSSFAHRSENDIEYPRRDARIFSITCCRDNERLLVGGEGILDICNIKTRTIETSLPVHGIVRNDETPRSVLALDFAPDGTKILERQSNGSVQIWKKQSVSKVFLPTPLVPPQISTVMITPTETAPQAVLPETSIPEPVKPIQEAANQPDGSVVYLPEIPSVVHAVAVKRDEKQRDWERSHFTHRKKLGKEGVTIIGDWYADKIFSESRGEYDSAFFIRDGTNIIDAQSDGFIRIWHVDGTQGIRFPAGAPVCAIAKSRSGRLLHFATAIDRYEKLWPGTSLLQSAVFNDRNERHHLMTVDSRNGGICMSQLISLGKDHIEKPKDDMGPITTISVSRDGQKIFFGGKVGCVSSLGSIGRTRTQNRQTFVLGHIIASVFSPDGSEIYFADSKRCLYRYSSERNSFGRELEPPLRFENSISSLKISPDFSCIGIANGTNKITLIPLGGKKSGVGGENVGVQAPNLLHFQRIEIEFDLPNRIYCCAFSPEDGYTNILAGGDGVIYDVSIESTGFDYARKGRGPGYVTKAKATADTIPLDDPDESVVALDYSPDGYMFLARLKNSGEIRTWKYAGENRNVKRATLPKYTPPKKPIKYILADEMTYKQMEEVDIVARSENVPPYDTKSSFPRSDLIYQRKAEQLETQATETE